MAAGDNRAPQCTATSKRTGKRCARTGVPKPGGGWTSTCYYHGGKAGTLPHGHPERGGQPPKTFLYARNLPPERLEVFLHALEKSVGSLDYELALARTNLDAFVKRMHAIEGLPEAELAALQEGGVVDPERVRDRFEDGVTIETKDGAVQGVKVWPYAQVVLEHLDKIRRLEQAAALLRTTRPPDGDDVEDYQTWLSEYGVDPGRSRSRRRRSGS